MKEAADRTDLVLVLGTSLSGLNSDRMAMAPARRSLTGKSLGTVIINLQQTACDGVSTLRVFASTDRLLELLLVQLAGPPLVCRLVAPQELRALVPYTRQGRRAKPGQPRMWLDLTKGARIRLAPDHNCQGANQPVYLHIGASAPHVYRGSVRQPGPGEGFVIRYSPKQQGWELQVEGVSMLLGGWWLAAAAQGAVTSLPVINLEPAMEGEQQKPTGLPPSPTRSPRKTTTSGSCKVSWSESGSSKGSS
jgi:hypothetical protein